MKLMNDIKERWKKDKVQTGFMGAVVILALLTYLKPESTESVWAYFGMTALNFVFISMIIVVILYMVKR